MSLNSLISYISNSQIIIDLIKRIKNNNELNIIGSSRYAKSIMVNCIAQKEKKDILLISPNDEIAYKWYGYFESIGNKNVLYYPPIENLPYASINKSKETEYSQLSVISKLIKDDKEDSNIIITTERGLQPHLINKETFKENIITLIKDKKIEIHELANQLISLGYKRENMTSQEGSWSRRGAIIDIYPVNNELPIRIEFFDNIIDKIREYDPLTQRTLDNISKVEIVQVGFNFLIRKRLENISKKNIFNSDELTTKNNLDRYLGIIEEYPSNLVNYIKENTIIIIDEIEDCNKFANNWYIESDNNFYQYKEEISQNLISNNINIKVRPNLHEKFESIIKSFNNYNVINLYEFESKRNINNRFLLSDRRINSSSKNIGKLSNEINKFVSNKDKVWILSAQPLRTRSLFFEHDCNTNYLEKPNDLDTANKLIAESSPIIIKNKNNYEIEGFYLPIWKVILITDKELFSQQALFKNIFIRKRKRSLNSNINLNKINPGDFIVHKNHGIGQFLKLEKINITGESRDYLVI